MKMEEKFLVLEWKLFLILTIKKFSISIQKDKLSDDVVDQGNCNYIQNLVLNINSSIKYKLLFHIEYRIWKTTRK